MNLSEEIPVKKTMNQQQPLPNRFYYSPIARIILGLVLCIGLGVLVQIGATSLLNLAGASKNTRSLVVNLAGTIAVTASYVIFYSYYEKRKIDELSFQGLLPGALLGSAIGAGLQSVVILILYLCGYYSIVAVNNVQSIVPGLVLAIASGITEEVIFRGILFRLIEEKLGSVIALAMTAVLFGFAHIFNPNATLYSAVAISIEAGLVLGIAYMVARSLWLPIFIHISWNFTEGGIFGAALSGSTVKLSLITSQMNGPALLTGGSFGPENSIIAVLLSLGVAALLFRRARQQGEIIPPFWRLQSLTHQAEISSEA